MISGAVIYNNNLEVYQLFYFQFIEKPPPVKAKFNFLKCGDGRKRFQKGNALNRFKNMHAKIKSQQKHAAFNTNVKKVAPTVGVPLKLKMKQVSPKELTNTKVDEPFKDLQDKSLCFLNNTDLNQNKKMISKQASHFKSKTSE